MVKTFNPNRVGGGTFSIVRDADGNYSLKEEGFEPISSLNMIDLGAVAATTTAAKTETAAEKTGTTTADQTKAAFLLPSGDKEDPFTFEKSLKSGADISKGLQDVETVSDRQKTESQLGATEGPIVGSFGGDPTAQIKSPTETVFGTADDATANILPDLKVETPQEKLKVTSANVQRGLVEPPLKGMLETLKGPMLKTDQTKFTKPSERAALGFPGDKSEVAQAGSTGFLSGIDTRSDQGLREVPATALGVTAPTGIKGPPSQISGPQIEPPARKTFIQSATTALKNVGDTAMKLAAMSPTLRLVGALGKQRNEDQATIGLNKRKFNVVTSPGSMQGRIVGDDGSYDPANNLFHGMNRASAFGNLESAGKKRIDRINRTIEKKKARGQDTSNLENRKNKFENELKDYQREKAAEQKATQGPAGGATTGSGGGGGGGGKSIVCTAMYQTTGLQDWAKAMKIWYIYQKRYLTIQHQEGYHKLFKPFVKAMHKSNIVKAIGAHFAKHRTQHLKHVLFKSKPSLLGKVYSKVLETICYWAGKK